MGGYLPDDVIGQVRDATNIAEVVSDYVALRRAGRNLVGPCPFHAESKPSFSVNEEKQIFHCFGCGEGGNVFTFLMKHNKMTFPEAVRELARRYGVRLPEPKAASGEVLARERLLKLVDLACNYFRRQLEGPTGARARDYLQGRGLNQETIKAFRLGYAPPGWDGLKGHLVKEGVALGLAENVGLLARKEGGSSTYDRFRDRVIFPITDVGGGMVAFGGRVMDDAGPKYLNSPESAIYSKSRLLYGLNLSRHEIRRGKCCLVVEGYLDLISLWQAGVRNVVATLGTALTRSHLRLLRGQGTDHKVIMTFDSDDAGQAAAARSLGLFLQEGIQARVLRLPQGEDPDSCVRGQGARLFLEAAEQSVSLLDFYTERMIAARGPSTEGRLAAARELAPLLGSIGSAVERAYYIKRLGERLNLDETSIMAEAAAGGGRAPAEVAARREPEASLERLIISLALADGEAAKRFAEAKVWEECEDTRLAAMIQQICLHPGGVGAIIDKLEPELAALAAGLSLSHELTRGETARATADCLVRVEARRARRESRRLESEIEAAERSGDMEAVRRLLASKMDRLRHGGVAT
ncbi:MAG: DNA primase [Pseudomonadota bacterium]